MSFMMCLLYYVQSLGMRFFQFLHFPGHFAAKTGDWVRAPVPIDVHVLPQILHWIRSWTLGGPM